MKQEHIDALRHLPIANQNLLIDGQWQPASSSQTLPVVSPIDGQTLCTLAAAGPADVDRAVQAARRTFEQGVWSRMAPAERKKVLYRIADRIEAHHAELAVLGVRDNGTEIAILQGHEYVQAAGRAGRLGIDTAGHVIHLNNLILDFCGNTLKPGGNLLMKIIMGPAEERLQKGILL